MKLGSIIGVDIGGSNIKAGRVSGGSVLQKSLISVKREAPEKAVKSDLQVLEAYKAYGSH
jgi:predicted NBD/HSP70 family sugar kinase